MKFSKSQKHGIFILKSFNNYFYNYNDIYNNYRTKLDSLYSNIYLQLEDSEN